jgi:hypothetical protein
MIVLYFIVRTHGFMEFSHMEQRMMNHSVAECTICSFKGLAVCIVYALFKTDGAVPTESEISEDEKMIKMMNEEAKAY